MITLDFQINPSYLVYHTITNCSPSRFIDETPDRKVVDFQNAAWSKDKAANQFLRFGPNEVNLFTSPSISEIAQRAEKLIQSMIADATFVPLLAETVESLELLKSEWENNYPKTYELVSEMTGLNLNGDFRIFLSHPALKQGHYQSELRAVCWAYRNTWPNYNTVYIWHELLHSFIPGGHLEHAVIQLIADNELRVSLNGGDYPPIEGHPYLNKLMGLLVPHWRHYLRTRNKEIGKFISDMDSRPDVKRWLAVCAEQRAE